MHIVHKITVKTLSASCNVALLADDVRVAVAFVSTAVKIVYEICKYS